MKLIGVALIVLGVASSSHAHFLWAEMPATGAARVTLSFAEAPGDDVLPIMERLAPKVQPSTALAKRPAVEASGLHYRTNGSIPAALVYLPYGVVDRGGQVYGLDYYAKAALAPTDAGRVIGKGFELVGRLVGDTWHVTPYRDGKPVTDAEVIVGAEGKETKAFGQPLEIPIGESPIRIPVRAVRSVKRSGSADGKTYNTVKEWTTLALPPVARVSPGSDADAYRTLEGAVESRETMRSGGDGWTVDFQASNGTDRLKGTAEWSGSGLPKVRFGGVENSYTKHVTEQLSSLFMHRLSRPFWLGDGTSKITWTDDTNDLGRKLLVEDRFHSSYRLKDGKIRQVVRTIGDQVLTLNIAEVKETGSGRYLTTRFSSESRDAKTNELSAKLEYRDTFKVQNGEWMPVRRELKGTAHGSPITMSVDFSSFIILDKTVKNAQKTSSR